MELDRYLQAYFPVTLNELEILKNRFKEESLEKGEYFLKRGRIAEKLSFIRVGLIRIYAEAEDKEVTQWISTSGYFVTDLRSLLFHSAASLA